MPLALWTLLWLNIRAGFRRIGRQARTPRGVIFAVLGMTAVFVWVLPLVLAKPTNTAESVAALREMAPAAILLFCALNVFASAGDRAVTFTRAEVDFLFPGPFTRRQLLVYKLIKTGIGGTVTALIYGRILLRFGAAYWTGVIGIWLSFQFIQMVAMVVALLRTTIGERMFSSGRRWALGLLVAVVAAVVVPVAWSHHDVSPASIARTLNGSTLWRCLLAPFNVFAHAVTADRLFPDALPWDAAAIAINAALIGVVLRLDSNYLETAAAASERRYSRMSRVRRVGLAGTANEGAAKLRVRMLPWLGGAGPIVWRQLTNVVRTGRGLLVVIAIVACVGAGTVTRAGRDPQSMFELGMLSLGATLFLSSLLKFDFRGDLDHLEVLRSLPMRATAVAAGELFAPTFVLSCVQCLLLVSATVWGHIPPAWVVVAAAFAIPVNIVLIGTENLLFLLFPSVQQGPVAGDMGMVGRRSIIQLCRVMVALVVGVICYGCGLAGWALLGRSASVATVAAWLPLPCIVVALVMLIGLVYDRFDPSVDTPTA